MSMQGETMKEVTAMNIDVVDVRLDERKLPYLVSELSLIHISEPTRH